MKASMMTRTGELMTGNRKVFVLCLALAIAMGVLSASAHGTGKILACPVVPSFADCVR